VAPALFVALREAAAKGDTARCATLQEAIEDLGTVYAQAHWLPALKAACAFLGFGAGIPARPLAPADAGQRHAIATILRRHRLLT
jgi:dihydrodipicolinate synthase/N-acetylneuraminate lyase